MEAITQVIKHKIRENSRTWKVVEEGYPTLYVEFKVRGDSFQVNLLKLDANWDDSGTDLYHLVCTDLNKFAESQVLEANQLVWTKGEEMARKLSPELAFSSVAFPQLITTTGNRLAGKFGMTTQTLLRGRPDNCLGRGHLPYVTVSKEQASDVQAECRE